MKTADKGKSALWRALERVVDPDTGKHVLDLGIIEVVDETPGSVTLKMMPWAHDRHVHLAFEALKRVSRGRPVEVKLDWDAKLPEDSP